jgi:dGTPase
VYSTVDLEDGLKKDILDWKVVEGELEKCALGKTVLAEVAEDVKNSELDGKAQRQVCAVILRTKAIGRMAHAVVDVFNKRYKMIMHGEYDGELVEDSLCAAKELIDISKTHILRGHGYEEPVKTSEYWGKLYLLISDNYRHSFRKRLAGHTNEKLPPMYIKLQLLTDHIAGMTDTYACQLHKDLFNGK